MFQFEKKDFSRYIKKLQKYRKTFAAASGMMLNQMAFKTRDEILETLSEGMIVRSPAFVKRPDLIPKLLNARHGWNLSFEDVQKMGVQCLETEEKFNSLAGIDMHHCDVPEFMRHEPLPPHGTVFDISKEEMNKIWEIKPENQF